MCWYSPVLLINPIPFFLTDLKPREIFLEPGKNMLKQVDIAGAEVHTGSMTDPEFHGQSAVYSRNADGSYKGGVTFRIWSNHSAERKLEKRAKQQHDEEVRLQMDQLFNQKNLLKYLPIKPEEVSSFRSHYMPDVKTFTSNNFNLLAYLDSCYKQFMKLPEERRREDKLVGQ